MKKGPRHKERLSPDGNRLTVKNTMKLKFQYADDIFRDLLVDLHIMLKYGLDVIRNECNTKRM